MSACSDEIYPKTRNNKINIDLNFLITENFDNLAYISARCSKTIRDIKLKCG